MRICTSITIATNVQYIEYYEYYYCNKCTVHRVLRVLLLQLSNRELCTLLSQGDSYGGSGAGGQSALSPGVADEHRDTRGETALWECASPVHSSPLECILLQLSTR